MEPVADPRRESRRPSFGALLVLGIGAASIAVLTLSDRVPVLIKQAVGVVDPRLGGIVSELLDVGHLLVWAAMAFGAMLLIHDRRWRFAALVSMAVGATALEVAQEVASASRKMNVGDAQSNLVGIAVGAVAGIVLTIDAQAAPRSRTP